MAMQYDGTMKPNLLMSAWAVAHLPASFYQAVVCLCGSSGEAAFRESLQPQYTSRRHDSKGLRTYYIVGTCGVGKLSRISSGSIGASIGGAVDGAPLLVNVTSITHCWQKHDLSYDEALVSVELDLERLVEIPQSFLQGCSNLVRINLAPLHSVKVLRSSFLAGCASLNEVNLAPLSN